MRQSLLLAPLALLLTGCGTAMVAGSDSPSGRTDEESSRVVATWHRTFPERSTFATLGWINYSRGIARYTHTWEDEPPTGPEIETRDALYQRVDAFLPCEARAFGGRHWVKYEPDGTTPLSPVLIGPFDRWPVEHPADLLRLLRTTTTVKRTWSAVQRGDKVVVYQAIFDVARALKVVPELRQDSRWFTLWPRSEEQGLPLEFAADGDGRLRRVAVTEPTSKSVTWEVEFFDYGAAVDVQPPSPDDVIAADEYYWKIDHELQPEKC